VKVNQSQISALINLGFAGLQFKTQSIEREFFNNKERIVRPWVKISLCQYEELKRLREKKGKPLSRIIREAVGEFLKKKDFPAGAAALSLARGTRNGYKSVSSYFPRSDWSLLQEIGKNTGKCQTELIRQAVDEHLKGHHNSRQRRNTPKRPC